VSVIGAAILASAVAAAQAPANYTVPKTPWGDPDLWRALRRCQLVIFDLGLVIRC
jgi:hypothetical protein